MERENLCPDAKGEIVGVPMRSPGTEQSVVGRLRVGELDLMALDQRRAHDAISTWRNILRADRDWSYTDRYGASSRGSAKGSIGDLRGFVSP
jgi:hypothetical protein